MLNIYLVLHYLGHPMQENKKTIEFCKLIGNTVTLSLKRLISNTLT
jgi:hypothetical protein